MISTLAVIPIMAELGDYAAQEGGVGLVYWTDTVGEGSIRLQVSDPTADIDEARVVFTYGGDLNSLDSVSYYGLIESTGTLPNYGDVLMNPVPYVTFSMATVPDGPADVWGVATLPYDETIWPELLTWYDEVFDDECLVAVSDTITGQGEWSLPQPGITLAELKETQFNGETHWGDFTVLEVKVGIGNWYPVTGDLIVYVDDVTITYTEGSKTYDFEVNDQSLDIFVDIFTEYTITATSTGPGTISPLGLTTVTVGGFQDYIITPDDYCYLSELTVTGDPTPSVPPEGGIYTFTPTDNEEFQTIDAVFMAYTVSIDIDLEEWDFGILPVGGTASTTMLVSNTGQLDVDVHADIAVPFFQDGLKLNTASYDLGWNLGNIPNGETAPVDMELTVPSGYAAGSYSGTLVFEATPPPP